MPPKSIVALVTLAFSAAPGAAVTVVDPSPPGLGPGAAPGDGSSDFTRIAPGTQFPPATPGFGGRPGSAFAGTLAIIPEPRVWALLVAGYGLVGFALRRRGAVPRVAG